MKKCTLLIAVALMATSFAAISYAADPAPAPAAGSVAKKPPAPKNLTPGDELTQTKNASKNPGDSRMEPAEGEERRKRREPIDKAGKAGKVSQPAQKIKQGPKVTKTKPGIAIKPGTGSPGTVTPPGSPTPIDPVKTVK